MCIYEFKVQSWNRRYSEMEDGDERSSGKEQKEREVGKKRKRPPELRDPNSPKRATSAYVFFCHEMRRKIRSGEVQKTTTMSRTISDAWTKLTSSEKQVATRLAVPRSATSL